MLSHEWTPPLATYDDLRQQTAVVFASSMACADAIVSFLDSDHGLGLYLALLEDGSGLSPLITSEPTLSEAVCPGQYTRLPERCFGRTPSCSISPSLLVSCCRIFWFVDSRMPLQPRRASADWSCVMNAELGASYGLTLQCLDEHGRVIPSPLVGSLLDYTLTELAEWQKGRRANTERVVQEGLLLGSDMDAPLLFSERGGAVSADSLDLSLPLLWKIKRLERWMGTFPYSGDWSEIETSAFTTELRACADDLRRELGTTVRIYEDWL